MFSTPRHGRVREGPHPWEGTFFDFFSGSVRAPNPSPEPLPGHPREPLPGGSRDPPRRVPDPGPRGPGSRFRNMVPEPRIRTLQDGVPTPSPGGQDPPGQGPGRVLEGGPRVPDQGPGMAIPDPGSRVPGPGSGPPEPGPRTLGSVPGWPITTPVREGPGRGSRAGSNPSWTVPG